MNKNSYIETLSYVLKTHNVRKSSIKELIKTYEHYYDELNSDGLTYVEIVNELGTPVVVYQNHQHQLKYYPSFEQIFNFLTPILSILLFLILYFGAKLSFELSSYAFFLIPFLLILSFLKGRLKIISLVTASSTFTYLLIGSLLSFWSPTWVIFFLIPITLVLLYAEDEELYYSIVFFSLPPIIYLLNYYSILTYDYSWQAIFILVILYYLLSGFKLKKGIGLIALIVSIILYNVFLSIYNVPWNRSIYIYAIWLITFIINGEMYRIIRSDSEERRHLMLYLISISFYIISSLILSNWAFTLIIFIVIPFYYIFKVKLK